MDTAKSGPRFQVQQLTLCCRGRWMSRKILESTASPPRFTADFPIVQSPDLPRRDMFKLPG